MAEAVKGVKAHYKEDQAGAKQPLGDFNRTKTRNFVTVESSPLIKPDVSQLELMARNSNRSRSSSVSSADNSPRYLSI